MPRLAFALISVLSHVVAQETRITDPAAAASAENTQFYELIKAEVLAPDTTYFGADEYPYFKSGLLAVSSIEEGLFLVKRADSSRRLRGARV